ncbi:MAG: pantoate--beta-alanine ligase [Acidimicrobiales bacterium]
MELIGRRTDWRSVLEARRQKGESIGVVPTMGALHDGHLSLVAAAVGRCDFVTMTIFVNPLQFGEASDLEAYPRDLERDLEVAEAAGVHAVFAPSVEEMYPAGKPSTVVAPGPLAARLEGTSRPSHFEGVATVVTKLFGLAGASSAFFGEKDFQQLAIVRQLVADLDLPVEIVGCPIVREADGLAMSSRNRRLSSSEREAATALFRSLVAGRQAVESGCSAGEAEQTMHALLQGAPRIEPDYAVAADPINLERLDPEAKPAGTLRLLVAAGVGPVRLIDNLAACPPVTGAGRQIP